MTIALAPKAGRYLTYINDFRNYLANYRHLPRKTFLDKYKQHIINEIRYLALAITDEQHPTSKQISMIWPIKSIVIVLRNKITIEQAGRKSTLTDDYYLFELGKPLTLKDTIKNISLRSFRASMKLTTLAHLQQTDKFNALEQVYEDALI